MTERSVYALLFVVGLVLLAVAAVSCGGGGDVPPPPPTVEEPSGDLGGEELLEARCTRCHTLDRVRTASKTFDEWTATVERMRGKGAELTDGEADTLLEYLAETYGP